MSLQGKVIAITGGASGIGLATANLVSSRGGTVCIADIDPNAIAAAESHFTTLKVPFLVTKVNVAKRSEVDAWIDSIIAKFGKLDGAVNSAGVIGKFHGITPITELEDEEWDRIISVNLTGLMYSLRAELRKISEGGSIVNISSIQGVMGSAAYGATKHGVIGLTRSAAKENGERNVRVNAVAPGSIETPLLQLARVGNPGEGADNNTAIKRAGTSEEMANIIGFLLSPESSFVTGSVYGGDGGWNC
ncbi:3-oxoacyl-[acyl-carrier-protein] reductase FabG [Lachnellula suecica]|uniref:3-oxoacyl-[acyl-carrier-protein] reductase FabG n=1 Tax=Lachnellula suecica TaxID=602035 RepID=A0A8T9C020_9HELO|nr:3-oxoacyl-[acyl-carrier-protein] reductase FabG [Lachnellula suecica]